MCHIMRIINSSGGSGFEMSSKALEARINAESREKFLEILREIGTIPESIVHDSTEEKLFSKASDAVLARAFRELGLKSAVLRERGDSADVIAESPVHGYTLAADAKAFRLSRTAKNQKDFKVAALSGWRKDSDYAVLCAPYFQYPSKSSQIYAQALDFQVTLISWEHLIFLMEQGARETETLSFSPLWNFSYSRSRHILYSERKQSLLEAFNQEMAKIIGVKQELFSSALNRRVTELTRRGKREIAFWEEEIREIEAYSREEAIRELIESKKIRQKMNQIDAWIRRLRTEWTN